MVLWPVGGIVIRIKSCPVGGIVIRIELSLKLKLTALATTHSTTLKERREERTPNSVDALILTRRQH